MVDIENGGLKEFTALIVEQLREQRDTLSRLAERVEKLNDRVEKVNDGMGELREVRVKLENLQLSVNGLQSVNEKTNQLEHRVHLLEKERENDRQGNDKRSGDSKFWLTLLIALVAAAGTLIQAYSARISLPNLPSPAPLERLLK